MLGEPVIGVLAPSPVASVLPANAEPCVYQQAGFGRCGLPRYIVDAIYRVFCWQTASCSFNTFVVALYCLCFLTPREIVNGAMGDAATLDRITPY